MVEGRRDVVVSDLAVTEVVSFLARRRREGTVTAEAAARLYRAILSDLESGVFLRLELTRETHRQAERFLLSLAVPLRAADALHLTLAVGAGAASALAFDRRLREAVGAVGLSVFPPRL